MKIIAKQDLIATGIYGTDKDNCDLYWDIISIAFLCKNRLYLHAYLEYIFTLQIFLHMIHSHALSQSELQSQATKSREAAGHSPSFLCDP